MSSSRVFKGQSRISTRAPRYVDEVFRLLFLSRRNLSPSPTFSDRFHQPLTSLSHVRIFYPICLDLLARFATLSVLQVSGAIKSDV